MLWPLPVFCAAAHVIAEGWDYHHESKNHFEISIPMDKVADPRGGVMLAWKMNGQELLPDHGYPVSDQRVSCRGCVGGLGHISRGRQSRGGAVLAWKMNEKKLLPGYGCPVSAQRVRGLGFRSQQQVNCPADSKAGLLCRGRILVIQDLLQRVHIEICNGESCLSIKGVLGMVGAPFCELSLDCNTC